MAATLCCWIWGQYNVRNSLWNSLWNYSTSSATPSSIEVWSWVNLLDSCLDLSILFWAFSARLFTLTHPFPPFYLWVALEHHKNKSHLRMNHLCPLVCVDSIICQIQSALAVKNAVMFMQLNIDSRNNKPFLIYDVIIVINRDLTETWKKTEDFIAPNRATPSTYEYIQKPCTKAGGGLTIIHQAASWLKRSQYLLPPHFSVLFSH